MEWILEIDRDLIDCGMYWAEDFVDRFDTSQLDWIRVTDKARSPDNEFMYGRCWYPDERRNTDYRITIALLGYCPIEILTRKPLVYQLPDGTWPKLPRPHEVQKEHNPKHGMAWKRIVGITTFYTRDEALVWFVAHEMHHYLARSGRVASPNNEIEADLLADLALAHFRTLKHGVHPSSQIRF